MKMEAATPITISSASESQDEPHFIHEKKHSRSKAPKSPSIISLSSESERVPVSWTSRKRKKNVLNSSTPSGIQRVNSWIKACNINTEKSSIDKFDGSLEEKHSLILLQCDFDKDIGKTSSTSQKIFNQATSLYAFMEERKSPKDTGSKGRCDPHGKSSGFININKLSNGYCHTESMDLSRPLLTNSITLCDNRFTNDNKSKMCALSDQVSQDDGDTASIEVNTVIDVNLTSSTYNVPLSPESQKKELCSYLQLMNPADKKEILLIQNRRSTRVKNLSIMHEKKELERKLKNKDFDKSRESSPIRNEGSDPSSVESLKLLKSFKDLNMAVDENRVSVLNLSTSATKKAQLKNPYIPLPPKRIFKTVENFDITMKNFITANDIENLEKKREDEYNRKLKMNSKILSKIHKALSPKMKSITKKNKTDKKISNIVAKRKHNGRQPFRIRNLKDVNTSTLRSKAKCKGFRIQKLKLRSTKSLRSTGALKNTAIKKLLLKQTAKLKNNRIKKFPNKVNNLKVTPKLDKPRTKPLDEIRKVVPEHEENVIENQFTEIDFSSSIVNNEHKNIDVWLDDIQDFNCLSEEHKRCLLESRVISAKPIVGNSSPSATLDSSAASINLNTSIISSLYGFAVSEAKEGEKYSEVYKSLLLKPTESNEQNTTLVSNEDMTTEEVSSPVSISVTDKSLKVNGETDKVQMLSHDLTEVLASDETSNCSKMGSIQESSKVSSSSSSTTSTSGTLNEIDSNSCEAHEDEVENEVLETSAPIQTNDITATEHDYSEQVDAVDEDENEDSSSTLANSLPKMKHEEISPGRITKKYEYVPLDKDMEVKSLHRSLTVPQRKLYSTIEEINISDMPDWDSHSSSEKQTKNKKRNIQSHSIHISKESGGILNAFYIDYNLIVCQEYVISLWTQSALGNVLGAQNMYIPRGHIQRLVLNSKCIQKQSMEMIVSTENSIAYVELWTEEHKSDIREGPVADVFATVYFWKQRQNGLDKKVLQLENINGFADDVQYAVLKCSPKIIVSWHSVVENDRNTFIHCYQLASDFQTVANIKEVEAVTHYVSSLHNIEDSEDIVMGCGENKVTLWNVEYGYIVATIELSDIKSPLSTLWVKCDRGFLFMLQQCVDRELRLIAINGITKSWKRLQTFNPPPRFDRLKGVYIENGILVSFYEQGILCWNAQTGEPVVEEVSSDTEFIPAGKYVIMICDGQIIVKHALTHLITADDT